MDEAEFQTFEQEVLGREIGLVAFGKEQFAAMIKAVKSLDTLGIEAPTKATL